MKTNSSEALHPLLLIVSVVILVSSLNCCAKVDQNVRDVQLFTDDWRFHLGDVLNAQEPAYNDSAWRMLDLPHDWSIEGEFSEDHPATASGGALPGGIGWYRKSFTLPLSYKDKLTFIDFDGIYRNSEVWINGEYLGKRPNGYISFRYDLTPFLHYGDTHNVITVKVDNSQQPNSRWYSGSGIYRNVKLVTTGKLHVEHWGTFITTPTVNSSSATISIETRVKNATGQKQEITLITLVNNPVGKEVGRVMTNHSIEVDSILTIVKNVTVEKPQLWSTDNPRLYQALTKIKSNNQITDDYETDFGIRFFNFDVEKGFFLNGKNLKIRGVCNHHDLGCLGAAINTRAIERQLEILKDMGCNGIRTSHNPPAPELLNLCDKMGFIVMDEAFDVWAKKKTRFGYHEDFADWHKRDLQDLVLHDRNHPSVFIWSIGNEIIEQYDKKDPSGSKLTKELAGIVKTLDKTRPVTSACNETTTDNPLFTAGVLDLIGFNYHHEQYADFAKIFPGQKFIATETESALATRGSYDMPSDSIRRWPKRWDLPFYEGNMDYSCSSYDNCSVPWGSTHEETWKVVKKYDFISGMFIWTGFDYLGEPTPYGWPAKSSYFGIIDLAGFPKDAYYLYQSEWTDKEVLHVFPHWNWPEGKPVDIWVYTSCDEVELFLNDQSLGRKTKSTDDLHLMWQVQFKPGTIKALGHTRSASVLTKEIKTASSPARISLSADRAVIKADGRDLSFVTVKILDQAGTLVPNANNLVNFRINGDGKIVAVDNGSQVSHGPFQASYHKAFNGMCLVVIQSDGQPGTIKLEAESDGLEKAEIQITTK